MMGDNGGASVKAGAFFFYNPGVLDFLRVGLGAAIGAMLRYGITLLIPTKDFPWGTVIINLSGSFLLGVVAALWAKEHPVRLLIGIGFLGGYTTYSTYALEIVQMFQKGQIWPAVANASLQAVGSILCCGLGFWLCQKPN